MVDDQTLRKIWIELVHEFYANYSEMIETIASSKKVKDMRNHPKLDTVLI